jgi:hypothetical protein
VAFGVLFTEPDPRLKGSRTLRDGGGVGCAIRSTNDGTGVGDVRDRRDALSATGSFASLEADARSYDKRSKDVVEISAFLELDARDGVSLPMLAMKESPLLVLGELPPLMLAMKEFSLLFLWVKNCSTCQSAGGGVCFGCAVVLLLLLLLGAGPVLE